MRLFMYYPPRNFGAHLVHIVKRNIAMSVPNHRILLRVGSSNRYLRLIIVRLKNAKSLLYQRLAFFFCNLPFAILRTQEVHRHVHEILSLLRKNLAHGWIKSLIFTSTHFLNNMRIRVVRSHYVLMA